MMLLIWVVLLALLIGITLGALGGGGAILTVPILVYLLNQSPRAATVGSLAIVSLVSLVGMVSHARAGRVRVVEGLTFGVLGVIGSIAGSRWSAAVQPHVLMTAFAVLMLLVAGLMTHNRRTAKRERNAAARRSASASGDGDRGTTETAGDQERPHVLSLRPLRIQPRALAVLVAAATGVGLLTGFFGVGGGFAVVPGLVLALGFDMPAAVGTSLLVIVVNSVVALAARIGAGGGEVNWPVILTFSVLGAIGSLIGSKIAQRVDPTRLNLAFTVLLVLVAIYVAAMNVPALIAS